MCFHFIHELINSKSNQLFKIMIWKRKCNESHEIYMGSTSHHQWDWAVFYWCIFCFLCLEISGKFSTLTYKGCASTYQCIVGILRACCHTNICWALSIRWDNFSKDAHRRACTPSFFNRNYYTVNMNNDSFP